MNKNFILLIVLYLLAGCAQKPIQQNIPWLTHQQQLENLTDWSFSGKLAVITPSERHSLNVHWQQSQNNAQITLTTFLGITVLELKKTPSMTQIINNEGEHFSGEDAETLIRELSGFVIPVNALQQWIKGNPTQASYQLNADNQVMSLAGMDSKNALWSINYSDYRYEKGFSLPYKLQLKHADIRLKFAISQWKIR